MTSRHFGLATPYLWAMLLARIYESALLMYSVCKADMQNAAFLADGISVHRNLTHVGKSADPQCPLSV